MNYKKILMVTLVTILIGDKAYSVEGRVEQQITMAHTQKVPQKYLKGMDIQKLSDIQLDDDYQTKFGFDPEQWEKSCNIIINKVVFGNDKKLYGPLSFAQFHESKENLKNPQFYNFLGEFGLLNDIYTKTERFSHYYAPYIKLKLTTSDDQVKKNTRQRYDNLSLSEKNFDEIYVDELILSIMKQNPLICNLIGMYQQMRIVEEAMDVERKNKAIRGKVETSDDAAATMKADYSINIDTKHGYIIAHVLISYIEEFQNDLRETIEKNSDDIGNWNLKSLELDSNNASIGRFNGQYGYGETYLDLIFEDSDSIKINQEVKSFLHQVKEGAWKPEVLKNQALIKYLKQLGDVLLNRQGEDFSKGDVLKSDVSNEDFINFKEFIDNHCGFKKFLEFLDDSAKSSRPQTQEKKSSEIQKPLFKIPVKFPVEIQEQLQERVLGIKRPRDEDGRQNQEIRQKEEEDVVREPDSSKRLKTNEEETETKDLEKMLRDNDLAVSYINLWFEEDSYPIFPELSQQDLKDFQKIFMTYKGEEEHKEMYESYTKDLYKAFLYLEKTVYPKAQELCKEMNDILQKQLDSTKNEGQKSQLIEMKEKNTRNLNWAQRKIGEKKKELENHVQL